jgi:hypothetical protein
MIEGSGSIPLTNGSGSGSRRTKNMWIGSEFGSATLTVTGTKDWSRSGIPAVGVGPLWGDPTLIVIHPGNSPPNPG